MISLFDTVELKRDVINTRDSAGDVVNVPAGNVGTIVMVYDESVGNYDKPVAYEVDFCDSTGETIALLTLSPDDIKLDRAFKTMKKPGNIIPFDYVLVAQLDRASVSEAEGLGFKSQRAQ